MAGIVRTLLLVLAVAALPGSAHAQVPADEVVTFHGLTFPAVIAGAQRFSVREYEKDSPGLGYSVGYRQPGAVSTVYIYDLKTRDIPDDPSASAIKAQFDAAKADMMAALRQGLYSKFESRERFWVADGHDRARLRCGAATVVHADAQNELATYLCVGGWNNKFIKFRMTGEQLPQASVRRFLQAWMDLLWPR
ncbi:MAG TPA: hypothetical protein VH397_04460 [Xanthobacteraceae bacterium]|jgi:hypothetical protein